MRQYEMMVILDPEVEERTVQPSLEKYLTVVTNDKGTVDKLDIWGRRRLAYPIKKKADGIYAVIFVIVGIMGYLWIRFEKRFAIAALATEVHDVLVTLGIFALTQREFDLTVLASVLAVVGYSINDKVVVFDRVREMWGLNPKGRFADIANRGTLQTVPRTINTGMGALFILAALAVLVLHGR